MSGSGNQPNAGGEQPRQGGQPQGGQPQGGQPQGGRRQGGQPQGGQQRQPQGGYGQAPQQAPPGGPGESPIAALKRPVPKSFLKGIIATMALGGILLSVLSTLVGKIGGFTLLPGAVSFAQRMAGATGGTTGTGTGGAGTGGAAANPVSTAVSTTHDALMAYLSTELAPFIVFVLAIVFGAVVAIRMDDDLKPKLSTAGVGVLVGSFVFVLLVGFIASIVAPSLPPSMTQQMGFGGAGAAAGGGQLTALGTLQMTNLLINSILIAILGALTAIATTYSADRFFPA